MKQRILSAVVGLIILAVVFLLFDTLLLNAVIAAICVMAVFELLNATGTLQFRGFAVVAALFAVLMPFAIELHVRPFMPLIIFLLVITFFLLVLKYHSAIKFEQASMMLFFSLFVPVFFSCAVYLRDYFGDRLGMYYLMLALGSAWLCDSGAYFAGVLFGKHKMAPTISPKKTVEGAVGGLITGVVFNLLIAWLFTLGVAQMGMTIQINYLVVGLISPVLGLLGMMGDLVASVIKRQYGVKDYGHIMPGHGGIMDRFDSVLLTLPAVFIISQIVTIAS